MLLMYMTPIQSKKPVICMDEKPYQLLGDARESLPMRSGDNQKLDSEYVSTLVVINKKVLTLIFTLEKRLLRARVCL